MHDCMCFFRAIQAMVGCTQWQCWQNELVYISKLYPFSALMQSTYNGNPNNTVPKLGSISLNNLKGQWYRL